MSFPRQHRLIPKAACFPHLPAIIGMWDAQGPRRMTLGVGTFALLNAKFVIPRIGQKNITEAAFTNLRNYCKATTI